MVNNTHNPKFFLESKNVPICDLGFITSTILIFDSTGYYNASGMIETGGIEPAFNSLYSTEMIYPEYNISTRLLYKFDDSSVKIISPSNPPVKNDRNLLFVLLPSLFSIVALLLVRIFLMNSSGSSGLTMVLLSVSMGLVGLVTTIISWVRQKKEYKKNLESWRSQYENYINLTIKRIHDRQASDVKKMKELYPDVKYLIKKNQDCYGLDHVFSRSQQDEDFLSFQLGISNDVESKFSILGDSKEEIFSSANFIFNEASDGTDTVSLYLNDESPKDIVTDNLCNLPAYVANHYKHLNNAPLAYSLKDKSVLGIVDNNLGKSAFSRAEYIISRMIFELCYYHSPDDLQFVMFFNEKEDQKAIDDVIKDYKFMPHFRGLFSDKSQFVFDKNSAGKVLSSLMKIMTERKESGDSEKSSLSNRPHIVFIVYDEHGLKEHAFANFLPKVPEADAVSDNFGLTFIFAKKYKEYLPEYCDDVIDINERDNKLTPRNNILNKKSFTIDRIGDDNWTVNYSEFRKNASDAYKFYSSIYYAHIAQNGKVPSSVGLFGLYDNDLENISSIIKANWGLEDSKRSVDITSSLSVPIGKTETGTAFLDLHEKYDGPHMLVAGTTGSGKTETVISYLLALCIKYRPDELNMLLVDMKGGGFTKRIGKLPHVVGSVTDVEGDENGTSPEYMLRRFLFAMKSEIKRRKLLLNKLHVDSVDAYIQASRDLIALKKAYEKGDAAKSWTKESELLYDVAIENPLSHLILVVDEFTELKRFSNDSDLDFMGEITTIARIGRSLGFHIILISQNIEGAITDDIRVNTKSRLCLRVATKQASKEMIGTDLAASPSMPGNGRAYLLVGTGSKFEYFQSGYSGVSADDTVPIKITLANKVGEYTVFYQSDKDNTDQKKNREELKKQGLLKTQLEVAVNAINSVFEENKEKITEHANEVPHMIFRKPLPECIALNDHGKAFDIINQKEV